MSISASHTATFDNVAAFGPPSSRRKVAFWLLAGMWSVVCVEVPAGSTMFPFFTVWGVLVVWPLYLLHIVFFAGVVFRFGKPSFWPLYAAGMIFGMYEAYITKVVWTSFRPEGPFYTLGGIALFETIICALFLHPLLAFVVPLLLAELVLTSSNEVLLGLPRRIQNSILKRPALWLGALVAMFGLMQFVNSPSVISSFLSGAGNGLVLGLAVLWWRRTGGSFHSLRDLLPGPAGLKIFGGILLAWYIFWGFAIKPKSIPSILPGQLIVWLIYAALFLILYNCLLRSRRTTEPAYPEKQLSFGWRGFVLCFLWATLVTVTARLLLHRFALLQIAVFFSFYVLTGIALLIGAVVYAFGPHARLSMNLALLGSLLMGVLAPGLAAAQNLVSNGGFETGTNNWRSWSRSAGALTLNLDQKTVHSGSFALHLEHRAEQDWSLEPALGLEVRAGDVLQLECWVKVQGPGSVTLCASTWDEPGRVVEWSAGEHTVSEAPDWQRLSARVIVSENVARLQPRLIGSGPVEIWVDDYSVSRGRNILSLRPTDLPPLLTLSNAAVAVVFDTSNATFSVQDLVSGRLWRQQTLSNRYLIKKASVKSGELQCSLLDAVSGFDFTVTASLDAVQPELIVTLAGQGQLLSSLRFPSPFEGESGDYLVVPMNEGISYPVDDPSIPPIHLIAYGGHGICMAFFGMTDGQRGQMTILETPDDASIRIERLDGRLAISPEWDAQLGQFGYARRLRYVFFDHGGHVAMAKRYRAYAKETGLFKTLTEKQKVNPSVDRLIGAVNVWCWDRDSVEVVREMQAAGIQRILWSNQQPPDRLKALNELGVLTSRYDIYQDVMAPTNFPRLRWIHPDWTTNAWPSDIILDRRGNWIKGWGVESRDGPLIPCGVLCDRFGPQFAQQRVPADLATHPYLSRFIDTTTAAPWNECYSPQHPMTRSDSRKWKMELLRYMSEENKLVTGSETGHDAAVPSVHYFEGMMSLGPYRVPDAGRRMAEIWTNVPEAVAKFQLGQKYRLPLWELVYHDCVVAHWYWGDYNNKLPSLWDKRDLFNVLYGVPPMFMFDRKLWESSKARFVQSYRNTCSIVRRVGYQEMTDHRFLTQDRNVQQTSFANGVCVTVNFGATDFILSDGRVIKPSEFLVIPP